MKTIFKYFPTKNNKEGSLPFFSGEFNKNIGCNLWKSAFFLILLIKLNSFLFGQVKIGDNPNTINSNSLIEMESANKGMLPPRIAINDAGSIAPLTGTVPVGMLIYSSGGTVTDGYYFWNGVKWETFNTGLGGINVVTKTTSSTLSKTETFVLAKNDITITLPVVTSADEGLSITIKNIGTFTDLITVAGSGGATIDGTANSTLTRWVDETFVASGSNWVVKNKKRTGNLLEVSAKGSWTTISEVIAFLNLHMTGPTIVSLAGGTHTIISTQVINLPHQLTVEGCGCGTVKIAAGTGLANTPMFRCLTTCYFKEVHFDATTLASYGTVQGEDAIRYLGSGTKNHVKECSFDGFNTAIVDSVNAEVVIHDSKIINAYANGLWMSGTDAGAKLIVSQTFFKNCVRGVNLDKGSNAEVEIHNSIFENVNTTDSAIVYRPATFSFAMLQINNNIWNSMGKFVKGFDFSRADGRDANANIEGNSGYESKRPHCKISVLNNSSITNVSSSGTWYKANFINTTEYGCKFAISGNKVTYLSSQVMDGIMVISGNVICNNDSKVLSIAVIKNGVTTTRLGETSLKLFTSSQPYQWSTNVYMEDLSAGDFFEIWITSNSNSDIYKLQDVQWFVNTQ